MGKYKSFEIQLVKGDIVITTGGFPNNAVSRTTNLMKIEVVD